MGNGEAGIAWADNGTLVYTKGPVAGSSRVSSRLVRVQADRVTELPMEPDYFRSMRVSPDGRRLAATMWGGSMWVYDLVRYTRMKLPDGTAPYRSFPAWTTDSSRVGFISAVRGFEIYWQRAEASPHRNCCSPESTRRRIWRFRRTGRRSSSDGRKVAI